MRAVARADRDAVTPGVVDERDPQAGELPV